MLYHKDIYMPLQIATAPEMRMVLRPTNHALYAAQNDRYGVIKIPASITFKGSDIVEAEVIDGQVSKVVVRLPYNERLSAIYVCLLTGVLKTVWFNLTSDTHKTLNANRYARQS